MSDLESWANIIENRGKDRQARERAEMRERAEIEILDRMITGLDQHDPQWWVRIGGTQASYLAESLANQEQDHLSNRGIQEAKRRLVRDHLWPAVTIAIAVGLVIKP